MSRSLLALTLFLSGLPCFLLYPTTSRGQEIVLVEQGAAMRYLIPDADPGLGWTEPEFDDAAWDEGTYGVGYSAGAMIATEVPDGTIAVLTRARFVMDDLGQVESLHLGVDFDDGYVAWLNGTEIARDVMSAGPPGLGPAADDHESSNGTTADYAPVLDITNLGASLLVEGENVLAVGIWNDSADSSDLALVPYLSINRPGPDPGDGLCGTLPSDMRLTRDASPYAVTCDTVVPAGVVLTIDAGVELRFAAGAGLLVEGRIVADGEAAAPVVMIPSGGSDWDGIKIDHHGNGGRACTLRHVKLSHADVPLEVDDTDDSPILVEQCTFDYWGDVAIEWHDSHGLLIRHCDFGLETPLAESDHETLHGVHSGATVEYCTFAPRSGYNDVMDISDSDWGEPVPTVRYNVFLGGEDDAIDYDNADGWIIGNIIMDHWPRPGATSGGNGGAITGDGSSRPVIANNIVVGCYHGIGFKNGSRPLIVNNLVLDCHVGVTLYKDSCGKSEPHGVLANNILWNNRDTETGAVQNLVLNGTWWPSYCQELADQATADVHHCLVGGGWQGAGNIDADPRLVDPDGGDFSLAPDSPALDAGFGGPFTLDGVDADALRAALAIDRVGVPAQDLSCIADAGTGDLTYRDLGPLELPVPGPCDTPPGAFVRGDTNDDGQIDVSDAVRMLLVLFAGLVDPDCDDARDANDDGLLNLSDPVTLLDHLFRGSAPPPAPYPSAGLDPTPDALTCARE